MAISIYACGEDCDCDDSSDNVMIILLSIIIVITMMIYDGCYIDNGHNNVYDVADNDDDEGFMALSYSYVF